VFRKCSVMTCKSLVSASGSYATVPFSLSIYVLYSRLHLCSFVIAHWQGSARVFQRRRSKSMEKAKIGRRDYVLDGTRHAKFCSDRSGVSVPQIGDFAVLLG